MFLRAMVRIFSLPAVASLNGTFHLSPHENILTIALINIHYLYNISLYALIYYFRNICFVKMSHLLIVLVG